MSQARLSGSIIVGALHFLGAEGEHLPSVCCHRTCRALHLRFEKGMVGLSFCDFVGNRHEKQMLAAYRRKEWPRRFKVDTPH